MKNLVLVLMMIFASMVFADEKEVLGKWATVGGESYVEIYKEGSKFNGKIIWLKEPVYKDGHELAGKEKIDTENPEEKLRERKIVGMDFLSGFKYKRGKYVGGKIYDPGSGKTYYCKMKIDGEKLIVRGSIDKFGLAGQSQEWTKLN